RNRIWESVLLALLAFTFFRPGFWMDMVFPPFEDKPPAAFAEALGAADPGDEFRLDIAGVDSVGEPREWVVLLTVPEGASGGDRLAATGITLVERDGKAIIDDVAFGSPAKDLGLDWDQEIVAVRTPSDAPSKYLAYIPAILVLALLVMVQRRR
ncbi:MAG: DUF3394 domain-containing protein, partial [Alphaproteobacteria bacterium]